MKSSMCGASMRSRWMTTRGCYVDVTVTTVLFAFTLLFLQLPCNLIGAVVLPRVNLLLGGCLFAATRNRLIRLAPSRLAAVDSHKNETPIDTRLACN